MNNRAKMQKQTIAWLETLPARKKNPAKFQMMFINGKMVFLPIFKNSYKTKNRG